VSHPLHSHRSVDVFVVDTPSAAGVAFGAPRTDAESTHVLCRHADEAPREFSERVLRRIERIRLTRGVRALWYVVGADVGTSSSALPLLGRLLPLLDAEATLTVVGPGSLQSLLFAGIDSVLQRGQHDLTVRAELYADGERSQARSAPRASRGHANGLPSSSGRAAAASRLGGWFPVEASANHNAPDSVRAFAS